MINAKPKFRDAASGTFGELLLSVSKNWKIVNPNAISDSDVLMMDINVRSLLIAVRSNDMAVRFAESSVEESPINSIGATAASSSDIFDKSIFELGSLMRRSRGLAYP